MYEKQIKLNNKIQNIGVHLEFTPDQQLLAWK